MENQLCVKHQTRSPKSSKKKPVKVVYISNPMKIKATPSEFRAVVQQLTGRYATSPPSPQPAGALAGVVERDDDEEEKEKRQRNSTTMDALCTTGSDLSYEYECRGDQVFDDLPTAPQMLENFPPLLPSNFGC